MKQRIYYLDLLRCFACILVVLMHSPYPGGGVSGKVVVPISLLTAPCIGLFFMVSGALLLPVKGDGIEFIKKRLSKVLIPLLVWTMVGIVCNGFQNGWGTISDIVRTILSIPFSTQGHGVLWFLYVLIGLYLVAPIISPWIEACSQKTLRLYLAFWLLTMSFPYFKLILDVNESITGTFYYMSGYIGYFVFGYYLRKYGHANTLPVLLWIPVPFIALGISKKYGFPFDLSSHFWYLCLPTAITAWSWFTIFKNSEKRACTPLLKFVTNFSNCSFGIYLMHIFIMRVGLWQMLDFYEIKGFLTLVISFVGTLAISYLLTWLISYLPFGESIIGYRNNK